MIIYLKDSGETYTVPSIVQQGAILKRVTVITNIPATRTMVLKILPPSQSYLNDIVLYPEEDFEGFTVMTASIPPEVTKYSGRAEYQIQIINGDGETVCSEVGSFCVIRGIITNMPDSAQELENYSLSQIYQVVANVLSLYDFMDDLENTLKAHGESIQQHSEIIGEGGIYDLGDTGEPTLINTVNSLVEYVTAVDNYSGENFAAHRKRFEELELRINELFEKKIDKDEATAYLDELLEGAW